MKTRPNTPQENKANPNQPRDPNRDPNKSNKGRRFNKPRPPRNFWKTMLTNKFFDLLVVIVGVSIAYTLNGLMVSANEQKQEAFYTQTLATDVEKDIQELEKNLKGIEEDYQRLVSYVQEYGQGKAVGDSLATVITSILSLDIFEPHDNAYESLLNANGLGILSDPGLRNQVTNYYSNHRNIKRFEEVYTLAISNIYQYFTPYCDYTNRRIVDKSVLDKVQTKNSLLIAASQLEDGIENYDEALLAAKALQAALKQK